VAGVLGALALFGTIAFAAVYWYGEHQLKAWAPRAVAFQEEMIEARLEEGELVLDVTRGGAGAPVAQRWRRAP
jgi:hypothetical protein